MAIRTLVTLIIYPPYYAHYDGKYKLGETQSICISLKKCIETV